MKVFNLASLWGPLAGLAILVACSSSPPSSSSAKQEEKPSPKEAFMDQWRNLKPEELVISDDAVGAAELTRNFYFILDGSGSMNDKPDGNCGGDQSFKTKMAGARWAIKAFLEQVPEDVNIGLYVFDSRGSREAVPLDLGNRAQFVDAVDKIRSGSGTPLAEAIRFGSKKLVSQYKQQLGYGEYRLVVVTDGQANDLPAAAVYAAKRGVPIYTIGLCVGSNHPLRQLSVSYRAADNFADLAEGLRDTLAELPNYAASGFE